MIKKEGLPYLHKYLKLLIASQEIEHSLKKEYLKGMIGILGNNIEFLQYIKEQITTVHYKLLKAKYLIKENQESKDPLSKEEMIKEIEKDFTSSSIDALAQIAPIVKQIDKQIKNIFYNSENYYDDSSESEDLEESQSDEEAELGS